MDTVHLCECGCGTPTSVALQDFPTRGYVKGQPFRFARGHHQVIRWTPARLAAFKLKMAGRTVTDATRAKISAGHKSRGIRPSAEATAKSNANRPRGEHNHSWRGGRVTFGGRAAIYAPGHHLSMKNGYIYEHILVAERHAGRAIARGEIVHHIDCDPLNNDPANLQILPSQAEHLRIHRELRKRQNTS